MQRTGTFERGELVKLQFIELGKLSVSKANMRFAKKAPDVSDILPSVRARGIICPVPVRPSADGSGSDGRAMRSSQARGASMRRHRCR